MNSMADGYNAPMPRFIANPGSATRPRSIGAGLGMPVKIVGMGVYLPATRVDNSSICGELGVTAEWIERVTGVKERRRASGETSAFMAAEATRIALKDADVELEDVDLFIGASTGPQQMVPCTAALLQKELNAPEGQSGCFDVAATCLSFMVALRIAALHLNANLCRCIVIASSELTSLSLNPQQPESAALFGDAAVAAVIRRSGIGETSLIGHSAFSTFSGGAHLTEIRGGGTYRHPNDPATVRTDNMFSMDGQSVLKMALQFMPPFFESFLKDANTIRADYDLIVPHQASVRGLRLMSAALGLERTRIFSNLSNRGNCIAASIPLALAESRGAGKLTRGQRVLLLGTGAGLTFGALDLIF